MDSGLQPLTSRLKNSVRERGKEAGNCINSQASSDFFHSDRNPESAIRNPKSNHRLPLPKRTTWVVLRRIRKPKLTKKCSQRFGKGGSPGWECKKRLKNSVNLTGSERFAVRGGKPTVKPHRIPKTYVSKPLFFFEGRLLFRLVIL